MRKRLRLALGLVCCAVAGLVCILSLAGSIGYKDRELYDAVKIGMSEDQMNEVLRRQFVSMSSGDFAIRVEIDDELTRHNQFIVPDEQIRTWASDFAAIVVHLDASRRVERKFFLTRIAPTQDMFSKLRRWLGLPWW